MPVGLEVGNEPIEQSVVGVRGRKVGELLDNRPTRPFQEPAVEGEGALEFDRRGEARLDALTPRARHGLRAHRILEHAEDGLRERVRVTRGHEQVPSPSVISSGTP